MKSRNIHLKYHKAIARKLVFIFLILIFGVILGITGLGIGPIKYSFSDIVGVLINSFLNTEFGVAPTAQMVIFNIRLPRIILALLCGFGLAITGMQMQIILRNPLASPFTLGVSSGAAFGAGLAIISGITIIGGKYMLIGNAFVFSLLPCFVVFFLSRIGSCGHGMLILAGIAMNFIFSSLSTLLSYFSNSEELKSLSLWTMGNLGRASWDDIVPLSLMLLITVPLLFMQNQKLNVLNAGDESAKGLGVNVERTRIVVLVLTSLVSASIICFTGMIGFVGLVSPHIVRMIIGNDYRYSLIGAGLAGSLLLMISDIVSLVLLQPIVLPIGVITSFMGVPLLLYLVLKRYKGGDV